MKYKSELVKEIVESRGHEKSSIHYQSECIETWIEEAKGAYPKLCDYESEWLNYIVSNPIGKNLFDLELVQGAHTYGDLGKKPNFNNSNTRVTNVTGNYIKVNPNTKITFSISNDIVFSIAELDTNGYCLGDTGWIIKSSHTLTTKEKTSYIGFNFRKLDNSIITPQEVMDSNPMFEISEE